MTRKQVIRIDFGSEEVIDALLGLLTDDDRKRVADFGAPVLHFPLTHLVGYESGTFERPYRPGDTYGDNLSPVGLEWKT